MTKDQLTDCPLMTAGKLLGEEWRLPIINTLLQGVIKFNDIAAALPGLSRETLVEKLAAMEEDGLINRTAYPEFPPRIEYTPSELSNGLATVIKELTAWGEAYQKAAAATE